MGKLVPFVLDRMKATELGSQQQKAAPRGCSPSHSRPGRAGHGTDQPKRWAVWGSSRKTAPPVPAHRCWSSGRSHWAGELQLQFQPQSSVRLLLALLSPHLSVDNVLHNQGVMDLASLERKGQASWGLDQSSLWESQGCCLVVTKSQPSSSFLFCKAVTKSPREQLWSHFQSCLWRLFIK